MISIDLMFKYVIMMGTPFPVTNSYFSCVFSILIVLMAIQAQLPVDMRPSLAPSLHNKIPASVRQV